MRADERAGTGSVLRLLGATGLAVAMAGGLCTVAVATLGLSAVVAAPASAMMVGAAVRDALRRRARLLVIDAVALATGVGFALAASLAGDEAQTLLGTVLVGVLGGFVVGRWWAAYAAGCLAVTGGLYGLLLGVILVPAVVAGVMVKRDEERKDDAVPVGDRAASGALSAAPGPPA